MYHQEGERWREVDWLCTPCYNVALSSNDNDGTPVEGTIYKAWYGLPNSADEIPFSKDATCIEFKVFPKSQKLGELTKDEPFCSGIDSPPRPVELVTRDIAEGSSALLQKLTYKLRSIACIWHYESQEAGTVTLEEGAILIVDFLKAPTAQEYELVNGKKRKTWNAWNDCAAASTAAGRRVKLEFKDAKAGPNPELKSEPNPEPKPETLNPKP